MAVPLDLTHVGIGTSHSFTSKNANTRVLVAIDNYLQSQIAGTSVTTTLDQSQQRIAEQAQRAGPVSNTHLTLPTSDLV